MSGIEVGGGSGINPQAETIVQPGDYTHGAIKVGEGEVNIFYGEKSVTSTPIPYKSIVLDLETCDTEPTAVILSIGAYKVDMFGKVMPNSRFHVSLKIAEQVLRGRTIGKNTMEKFWSKQTASTQAAAFAEELSVFDALVAFTEYVEEGPTAGKPLIWGNGVNFDNALLTSLYKMWDQRAPWWYQQDADWRTFRIMYPFVDNIPFEGEKHHAADDALHEARGLEMLIQLGLIQNPADPMHKAPTVEPVNEDEAEPSTEP